MKIWRVVGFDDGFGGFGDELAYIVGCVTAGGYVEGFLIDKIEVDGYDVTDKIVDLILRSRFKIQLRCILLSGITFAGFNVADVVEINERTGIPVLVVLERKPNFEKIEKALRKLGFEDRLEIMRKAGDVKEVNGFYVQTAGCNLDFAKRVLNLTVLRGKTPEPLRIAHLVASALIHNESKRR